MKRPVLAAALFFLAAAVPATGAVEPRATVFNVKAPAEMQADPRSPWRPLKKNAALPSGARVRTRAGGSVSVVLDRRLEGLVHLAENSRLEVLKSPDHLHLESGRLFLVLEEEKRAAEIAAGTVLTVLTPDLRVHMGNGGCSIDASPRGTEIKVYGGRAQVQTEPAAKAPARVLSAVDEGYKFFSGAGDGAATGQRFERLQADDYIDWQRWIRVWYEKKDDFEAGIHEKDVARKAAQKEET